MNEKIVTEYVIQNAEPQLEETYVRSESAAQFVGKGVLERTESLRPLVTIEEFKPGPSPADAYATGGGEPGQTGPVATASYYGW